MAKFVFTYVGGADAPATEAEREAVMAAWMGWFGTLGSAVKDPGNPFGASTTVTAKGTSDGSNAGITGYSIVDAGDLAGAVAMTTGCPHLAAGGSIEVHQTLDVM